MSLGASLRSRSESPLFVSDPLSGLGQCPSDNATPSCSSACDRSMFDDRGCPLFSAQIARKRAEQDSILLANRIRLLRKEEERTRKKTRDTEQKVQELLDVRRRNDERQRQREVEQARREAEEQALRAQQNNLRDQQLRKIEEKQRIIMRKNTESSSSVRQARELHNKVIQQEREEALAEVAAKCEKVRQAESAVARSRAKSESAKRQSAKSAVEDRILREEQAKDERMKEIEKMEREEAALLSKLQRSQERHRAAFMQLEDVLRTGGGGPPPPRVQSRPPSVGGLGSGSCTPSGVGSLSRPNALEGGAARAAAALAATGAAAAAAATATRAGQSTANNSRPPRPRGPSSAAALGSAGAPRAGSLVASASAPSSAAVGPSRQPRRAATFESGLSPATTDTKSQQQPTPEKSLSSCSTASGGMGSRLGTDGSGRSTPATPSPAVQQITYTTVDGMELNIPTEEDLDLASLLNS